MYVQILDKDSNALRCQRNIASIAGFLQNSAKLEETAFTPLPDTSSKFHACVQTSGVNTRVHEGCHAEVGQDEEEDQAIVERHSGRDHLCQPGAPRDTE